MTNMENLDRMFYHAILPAPRRPLWARGVGAYSKNADLISPETGKFSYYLSVIIGGLSFALVAYLVIVVAITALN